MSHIDAPVGSSIVAVYPDHAAAEKAIQQLHEAGFAKGDLSIIGRDFQVKEEPVGFVSLADYAKAGAATGALFGGLFGLLVGAGVMLIPGVGPVIVAGPLAAALLAGMEGAIAGTALGSLAVRAGRLGHPEGPRPQVRDADRGRQVHRRGSGRRGGHRSRPELARSPGVRSRGGLRAGIVVAPSRIESTLPGGWRHAAKHATWSGGSRLLRIPRPARRLP